MKTSTKAAYAAMLAGMMASPMSAKDLYISANGNDGNSGLAASSPRATLTSLNDIIEEGDVINVDGIIDLTKEIPLGDGVQDKNSTWGHYISYNGGKHNGFYINGSNTNIDGKVTPWKEITIKGEDPAKDGFDGGDAMRLFYVRGDNNKTTVTFENLTLKNGLAPGEGAGAIFIHDNGFVNVKNCVFENNHLPLDVMTEEVHSSGNTILKNPQSERGGAIYMQFGRLEVSDCQFYGNINRRGGAILATGGVLNVTNSNFEGNGADVDGKYVDNTRGGAVALWPLNTEITANFNHCNFIGNTAWNQAGALYIYNNTDSGNHVDAVFTNCSFIQNRAIDGQGGAVMVSNAESLGTKDDKLKNFFLTFANSSFFYNEAKSEAGGIFYNGGIEKDDFRMINCTLAKNSTRGNAGHGAGYTEGIANNLYEPANTDRHFYNCLFEQNECPTASDNKGEYSDFLMYGYFDIDHSYFGRIMFTKISQDDFNDMVALSGRSLDNIWVAGHNGNFGEESHIFAISEDAVNTYDYSAGVAKFFALNEGSELLEAGNPEHLTMAPRTVTAANGKEFTLQGYDISASDQMGFPRDGKCCVGAMTVSLEEVEPYCYGENEFPYINGEGNAVASIASESGSINFSNGVASAAGSTLTVRNLAGVEVAQGQNSLDINALPAGIYIISAQNASIKVVK